MVSTSPYHETDIIFIILCMMILSFLTGCDEDNIIDDINRPLAPVLSFPKNDTTDVPVPPTLIWQASANATSYGVQVSTDSLFANNKVYDTSGLTLTSIQVDSLKNATIYYWRVNASNDDDASDWQKCWRFTTGRNCPGLPIVEYAGKTYNTVQIGKQCWLKENLDVGTRIDVSEYQSDDSVIQKYCYNDEPSNCNIYGGLYLWSEAMKYSTAEGTQGICPEGWHIPTKSEYDILFVAVSGDGNALKAIGQGSGNGAGTNTSGFSALLAGYGSPSAYMGDPNFGGINEYGFFFTSTWDELSIGFCRFKLFMTLSGIYFDTNRYGGISVRCIKN